jgi:hypothetical protein
MKFSNYNLTQTLSPTQHEVLVGLLLGDGHLKLDEKGKYPSLRVKRAPKDIKYLEYQYNLFKSLCASGIKTYEEHIDGEVLPRISNVFATRAIPAFSNYYTQWYGSSKIPENIELTPLTLATWFCDDGNVENYNNKNGLKTKFATHAFGKENVLFLINKLYDTLNAKFTIQKVLQKQNSKTDEQYIIVGNTSSSRILFKYIENHVIGMGMQRKSDIWKNTNFSVVPGFKKQSSDWIDFLNKILNLNKFLVKDMVNENFSKNLTEFHLNTFVKKSFLTKAKNFNIKYNPFEYEVSDIGKIEIKKIISNVKNCCS